jgi:hypothetical protein
MPPDREFERELEELGAGIEYPPTPDLSRAVRRRLGEEESNTGTRGFWARLPNPRWAAAAAAFLLIIAVPSLSPALRANIDQWLTAPQSASSGNEEAGGAGQATRNASPSSSLAESEEDMPESGGALTASATPEAGGSRPLGEGLGLGERITLREAGSGSAELLLPATPNLGKPDEVYTPGSPKDDGVALVYGASRPALPPLEGTEIGLILTERPGGVEAAYLSEGTPEQAGLERANVGDGRGYWVPSGRGLSSAVDRTDGLHGSVLLWEQEGLALRMETSLPKKEAVRIAGSVH